MCKSKKLYTEKTWGIILKALWNTDIKNKEENFQNDLEVPSLFKFNESCSPGSCTQLWKSISLTLKLVRCEKLEQLFLLAPRHFGNSFVWYTKFIHSL